MGKSVVDPAWTVMRPIPGHENTVSTTTDPVIRVARTRVDTVRGGMRAFLKACFQITTRPLAPFALASFTYSESRMLSIAERVNRRYAAVGPSPRTTAGR